MNQPAKQVIRLRLPTSEGDFMASYSENGLCALEFPSSKAAAPGTGQPHPPDKTRQWHALTAKAVQAILDAKTPGLLPPLDLDCGTDFQKRVWHALLTIAPGETRSYAEVAAAIGQPKATRAVGGACGANPVPLLVPCHRVLAANHKIGGFSSGLHWKRLLLGRERA